MKLATALLLATAGLTAAKKTVVDLTASHKVSGLAARSLVRASRKLDDQNNNNNNNNNNNQDEDEFYFLSNYRMKFVKCVADYQVSGEDAYESSAVIVRLCPLTDVESSNVFGCTDDEAYGDYVVGINTFTEAIAQNMQQEAENNGNNNNNNDDFNLEEYAECREAEMDNQNDEGRRLNDQWGYYIGPKCIDVTNDKGKVIGSDIALGFFSDMYCSTESETTYYELTGQEIRYSNGLGLYDEATKCGEYNENGEMEIKELCQRLIEEVAIRCDAVYQGGCDTIQELEAELKASEEGMSGGMKFLIVLIVFAVLGAAAFFFIQRKKKKDALLGSTN